MCSTKRIQKAALKFRRTYPQDYINAVNSLYKLAEVIRRYGATDK